MKLLNMQSSPLPCYRVPPRPKSVSHHPAVEHPQLMSVPPHEILNFMPM